jgi:hypothetical protein
VKRKYYAVFDDTGNAWGTGIKTETAVKDAKKWVTEYNRDIKLKKPKEITKNFYHHINDNGGNKKFIKIFEGKKYI